MEAATIVSALIGLIVLICFFSLVIAVGDIRRILKSTPQKVKYIEYFEQGELAEFIGDKEKARECYRSSQFYIGKLTKPGDADKRNLQKVEARLKALDSSAGVEIKSPDYQ